MLLITKIMYQKINTCIKVSCTKVEKKVIVFLVAHDSRECRKKEHRKKGHRKNGHRKKGHKKKGHK